MYVIRLLFLCGSSGEARRVGLRSLRPVVSFGAMPFGLDSAVVSALFCVWSCDYLILFKLLSCACYPVVVFVWFEWC